MRAIAARLPVDQREVLDAYAEGVNDYLIHRSTLPFEFLLLGYEPDPWKAEDSLLILLEMFHVLSGTDEEERMKTVMTETLPSGSWRFSFQRRIPIRMRC